MSVIVPLEAQTEQLPGLTLSTFADGFVRPVEIAHAGDGRLFVLEQQGIIRVIKGGRVLEAPMLDISHLVSCCGERGLLGLAFPPDHASTGYFYVNYTNNSGDTVVERYRISDASPDVADADSAEIVLTIDQPFSNHNGGQLRFGADGMLWIGTGDGGSAGDPMNHGQSLDTLLGKILRIDVSDLPYTVPENNPFVGRELTRPEIWSYGWRNPWRFSFDRLTGDLWIGDVGQSEWEEIDLEPAGTEGGKNYGWRLMEGAHCFNPSTNCDDGTLELPILEYSHDLGCSVTAGFVYRGSRAPDLAGSFVYGDYCSGTIWTARRDGPGWGSRVLFETAMIISTFGEDEDGELYVADYGTGTIYRFEQPANRRRPVRRP
ncbi:MAG: PQQ-dependent sugar dehydrogenase [Thermoanaerobaculia bacterium]|nr:PQQ-dependent sugar dehydrogenase [Thermoanaerobaculia bacterium]